MLQNRQEELGQDNLAISVYRAFTENWRDSVSGMLDESSQKAETSGRPAIRPI